MGFGLGVLSGISFGSATVLARSLARHGLGDASVLSVRFGVAAALLGVIVVARGGTLRPARGEALAAVLLGLVGYGCCATFFFAALQRGSAGAVSLLFYAYPALVALFDLCLGRVVLGWRVVLGVLGAIAGTTIVVGGGDVSISSAGVVFALGAALAFAAILTISERTLVRTAPSVRAFWTAAGASVFAIGRGLSGEGLSLPAHDLAAVLAAGAATASAFGLMFVALARLGPTRAAVVLNVEAVAAVILGAISLGERIGPVAMVGAAVVTAAAVWTTWTVSVAPAQLHA